MGKKAHKKLRDLQRLQSLYGATQLPTDNSMIVREVDSGHTAPRVSNTPAHAAISHTHAPEIIRDLRGLVFIILLMVGLLLVMYWVVNNTSFEQTLINLGSRLA